MLTSLVSYICSFRLVQLQLLLLVFQLSMFQLVLKDLLGLAPTNPLSAAILSVIQLSSMALQMNEVGATSNILLARRVMREGHM